MVKIPIGKWKIHNVIIGNPDQKYEKGIHMTKIPSQIQKTFRVLHILLATRIRQELMHKGIDFEENFKTKIKVWG
jgi:hypothetical protein